MTNKSKNKHIKNKDSRKLPPKKKSLNRGPNTDIAPPIFHSTLEGLNLPIPKKETIQKKPNHQINSSDTFGCKNK